MSRIYPLGFALLAIGSALVAYALFSGEDDRRNTSAPPAATGSGDTTTGTDTAGGGFRAETVEEFLAAFATAFREGDEAFLLERLNPATIELYGEPQCKALIATLKDPTRAYELSKTSEPRPYGYNPDGRSITIPNTYTVTVQVTANGELSEQEIHLAPVTDTLTWFADCGDPIS